MTQPNTPGEAIRSAAQRHATTVEATRALSREIAEKRQSESEGAAPAGEPATP